MDVRRTFSRAGLTVFREPVISASAFAQSERPCDWCWIFHGINSVPFLGLSDSKFTYVDFTSWNEHLISLADEQSIFVPAKKNASIQLPHDEFQQFIDVRHTCGNPLTFFRRLHLCSMKLRLLRASPPTHSHKKLIPQRIRNTSRAPQRWT